MRGDSNFRFLAENGRTSFGHSASLPYARRYRIVMTSPLRSAATISPAWRPDSVSTAPF